MDKISHNKIIEYVTADIDTANNETYIVGMIQTLLENDERSTDDLRGLLDYIDSIFAECDITLDLLLLLNNKCNKRKNNTSIIYSNDYITYQLRCYPFDGISKYLSSYCNEIKNKNVIEIDPVKNKIIKCNPDWFDLHVKYIKRKIEILEKCYAKRINALNNTAEKDRKKEEKKKQAVESIKCECGDSYTRANKARHLKTQDHIKWATICNECDTDDEKIDEEDEEEDEEEDDEQTNHTVCGCGGSYTYKNKATHCKTKKHIAWEAEGLSI